MRAILKKKNWWEITQNELIPEAFSTNIADKSIMQVQLASIKVAAMSALTLFVLDDLIDTIAIHVDPTLAYAALKVAYWSGHQHQVLTLLGQLQTMKLSKGGSIEEYIKRARELKNMLQWERQCLINH